MFNYKLMYLLATDQLQLIACRTSHSKLRLGSISKVCLPSGVISHPDTHICKQVLYRSQTQHIYACQRCRRCMPAGFCTGILPARLRHADGSQAAGSQRYTKHTVKPQQMHESTIRRPALPRPISRSNCSLLPTHTSCVPDQGWPAVLQHCKGAPAYTLEATRQSCRLCSSHTGCLLCPSFKERIRSRWPSTQSQEQTPSLPCLLRRTGWTHSCPGALAATAASLWHALCRAGRSRRQQWRLQGLRCGSCTCVARSSPPVPLCMHGLARRGKGHDVELLLFHSLQRLVGCGKGHAMGVLPFHDLRLHPRKHVRCVQHCLILPPGCARAVLEGRRDGQVHMMPPACCNYCMPWGATDAWA